MSFGDFQTHQFDFCHGVFDYFEFIFAKRYDFVEFWKTLVVM